MPFQQILSRKNRERQQRTIPVYLGIFYKEVSNWRIIRSIG